LRLKRDRSLDCEWLRKLVVIISAAIFALNSWRRKWEYQEGEHVLGVGLPLPLGPMMAGYSLRRICKVTQRSAHDYLAHDESLAYSQCRSRPGRAV
jgi:hypothetical protein